MFPDSSPSQWKLALACMPGLMLILLSGLTFAPLSACLLALGGAFTVGFGAFKKFTDYPLAPMIIVALGMGLSAWIGSMSGNHFWLFVLIAACSAAACALVAALEAAVWWIVLQWAIALLVAGAYPGDLAAANTRAGYLMLGGAVQIITFMVFQRALYHSQWTLGHRSFMANLRQVEADFEARFRLRRYGIYAASIVVLCLILVKASGMHYGYWAPMTALMVLKLHPRDTLSRGLQRMLGTVGGCLLATLIAHFEPGLPVISLASLAFAFLAYGTQNRVYSLFTLFLTATVILTVALGGKPEWQAAWERVAATCMGGGLAIVVLALETSLAARLKRHRKTRISRHNTAL